MFANSNSKKGQVNRACPPALLSGPRDPSRGSDQAHQPETNTRPGPAHPELCSPREEPAVHCRGPPSAHSAASRERPAGSSSL